VVKVVMICRAKHVVVSGIFLAFLPGFLNGQTSPAGQNDPPQMAPAAASAATAVAPAKAHDDRYVIGESDVLSINVWKEQELTRTIPVRSDGKISLPLAGEIQAAGRTPLQLEQDITERLKNYITTPEVTVMVAEIHSENFNVMGQVAKPGSYSMTQASTVVDAIAAAGGFRDFAKQKGIYVLRQSPGGGETRFNFNYKDFIRGKNPARNIKLEPHDIVIVP
jgi:polysaccharide export outer membrane protein